VDPQDAIRPSDHWADLTDRVKGLADGSLTANAVRHAATVVLLRDSLDGPGIEAYLLRRSASMVFSGMYVFPGGRVDPDDAQEDIDWSGPPATEYAGVLTADVPLARALVCAAVRETFEESGVLLAGPDPDSVVADVSAPEWETDRQALMSREHGMAQFLRRRGLVLRADLVRPWAHWVTPEPEPVRFDTRFFVAALPTGQRPRQIEGEADRWQWMKPADALAQHADGEMRMLPPTSFTLAELTEYPDVASVMAAAAARDVRPVLPRLILVDDDLRYLLPGDELPGDGDGGRSFGAR
jgi:8-oxo-dGTP pyrophosphatase MutT (NUDIX family)